MLNEDFIVHWRIFRENGPLNDRHAQDSFHASVQHVFNHLTSDELRSLMSVHRIMHLRGHFREEWDQICDSIEERLHIKRELH